MDWKKARTTMLACQMFELRPPTNSATKMRNDDRPTDDETHGERLEDLGSGVEREEAVDDEVPFVENLDVQTLAELDEVLERSTMLVRNVIAALYRR